MKDFMVFAAPFFVLSGMFAERIYADEPLKDYSFIRGVCYPGG
jgi:hypothetical protein